MSKTLNTRIIELEREIEHLKNKIADLSLNTENKPQTPYTKHGREHDRPGYVAISPAVGMGMMGSGEIIWNDVELARPPINTKPDEPISGYNKHSHSRFSGGALDINTLEFVEYNVDWETDPDYNKHCQDYWSIEPPISTSQNTEGESVNRIGYLDLIFNADTQKWGTVAAEIDVKKTNLVMRDANGDIQTDANGNEMSSPLYNIDSSKTNVVWDTNAQVWRFYAVYA